MDNLPNDPPGSSNDNPNVNTPPSFGSNFDPHSNPVDPNNPYATPPQNSQSNPNPKPADDNNTVDPVQSWIAKHQPRDKSGHFKSESSQDPLIPNSPNPSNLPPLVSTKPSDRSSKGDYPPLFQIANPVTYLKIWWKKIMANEGIDIGFKFKLKPITALMIAALVLSNGVTFSVVKFFFPNSSPIFHRQVVYPGVVQKGEQGQYFLSTSDTTLWKLKPKRSNINLSTLENKQVVITGNLTSEKYLIEVSEVIVADTPSQVQNPTTAPLIIPNQDQLPKLYSNITWETNQKKLLIFTSGKRRIEQEGVYLESSKLNTFPQAFLDYYINQLTQLNFKQTLNSKTPDNITQSYEKDGLYLTFGVENVYTGSGDLKKITGYKAYFEHN